MHSLARVLGTTSKRVLDALAAFDGRPRSAHSSVDNVEAERVREALAAGAEEPTGPRVAPTSLPVPNLPTTSPPPRILPTTTSRNRD